MSNLIDELEIPSDDIQNAETATLTIDGQISELTALSGSRMISLSTVPQKLSAWTICTLEIPLGSRPQQIFIQSYNAGPSRNPDEYDIKVTGSFMDKIVWHVWRSDVHQNGNEKFGFHILAII